MNAQFPFLIHDYSVSFMHRVSHKNFDASVNGLLHYAQPRVSMSCCHLGKYDLQDSTLGPFDVFMPDALISDM